MSNLKNTVEDIGREEIFRGRFPGNLEVIESDAEPCFKTCVDTENLRDIKVEFNPRYETENPGKTAVVTRDVTRHEINHKGYSGFNGCPRTLDAHVSLIFEPVADVLIPKGFSQEDAHYVSNALEDTVLHSDLNSRFELNGITYFFDDIGRHSQDNAFGDFYEAHAKLNLFLFGSKKQKRQLGKYFRHSQEVKEALQNLLNKTGISNMKQVIELKGKKVEVKDRSKIRDFLNDEANWQNIAKIYAEEFSRLMNPSYALPLLNHSGKGTRGREIEAPVQEGNEFDREMNSRSFKQDRIQRAYQDGEGVPVWMDYFEALDLLYQSLAQKLNIKVQTFTKQSEMPIHWYGKRDFDPDKDNLKHTTFGFDDKGKVVLKKKRWHQDIPIEYKISTTGFPEMRFCLMDTSGSMKEPIDNSGDAGKTDVIPWGDKSKYHFALLSWYGLLEYLKQNHLLQQQNIALGNFSDDTVVREGLTEAKHLALKPQFGSTKIDMAKVKKAFKDRGMLVFTISDGKISNWADIKDYFIRESRKHHYFHLQLGSPNRTVQDLREAGLYVENIRNAQDLATKVIDLTDNLYRGNN